MKTFPAREAPAYEYLVAYMDEPLRFRRLMKSKPDAVLIEELCGRWATLINHVALERGCSVHEARLLVWGYPHVA